MSAAGTYGVEDTDAQINDVLAKKLGAKVRHRADMGSTLPQPPPGMTCCFKFVGVALGPDVIVVKYLALENEPTIGGVPGSNARRLKEAYTYVRKDVAKLAPPEDADGRDQRRAFGD